MHILFTDETNLSATDAVRFFVYGGVFFDVAKLPAIDDGIEAIRREAGYELGHEFKFDTRSRPSCVSADDCTTAKNAVLELAAATECRFMACVTHHEIAKKRTQTQLITHGANTVLGAFNRFLTGAGDRGMCIVDRLSDSSEYRYLTEKYTVGLTFPDGHTRRLDRIALFAASCIGASNAASLVDIVLGAFRYCINNPRNVAAAHVMMAKLACLLWSKDGLFLDRGIILRPAKVQVPEYKRAYDALVEHLRSLLQESGGAQPGPP